MIGIIGAMDDEVALLKSAITDIKTGTWGGFDFFSGKLEHKDVVLLRCGIGKVNAAVGCTLMINSYKPEFIINTGSAGGIDKSLKFGDAVISEGLLYHDVDVTAFDYAPGQLPNLPEVFYAPESLIKAAEKAVDELRKEKALPDSFHCTKGIIGSGDAFMHRQEQLEKIHAVFPAVKAVEMEGAAIAHVCFIFNVPSLIIRSLSDIAGMESPVTFNEFLPVASKHSAEIVRRLIKNHL